MNLNDVLASVGDRIDIERIGNGYIVNISGRNSEEDWKTYRMYFEDFEELLKAISMYGTMPLDD